MTTINISLPHQLKTQAEELIKQGYYASFSDMVRDALRKVIERSKYDVWTEEVKKEEKEGKTVTVRSKDELDSFMENM